MLMFKYYMEMLLVHNKVSSIVIIVEVLHNFGDNIVALKFAFLFLEC
jgi:hypothetical protein